MERCLENDQNDDASSAVSTAASLAGENLKRDNVRLRSKCCSLRRERRRLQDRTARLESELCTYRLDWQELSVGGLIKPTSEDPIGGAARGTQQQRDEIDRLRRDLGDSRAELAKARERLKSNNAARLAEAERGASDRAEKEKAGTMTGATALTMKSMEEVIRTRTRPSSRHGGRCYTSVTGCGSAKLS
mmetsp:Transcript_60662/g.179896  ORF Transcript_60662/g.179896 Transcript_60662/m.179896 type:complete len:189 (-) Transcript_60662:340-906(-)